MSRYVFIKPSENPIAYKISGRDEHELPFDLDAHEMVVELGRVLGGYLMMLDGAFVDQAAFG